MRLLPLFLVALQPTLPGAEMGMPAGPVRSLAATSSGLCTLGAELQWYASPTSKLESHSTNLPANVLRLPRISEALLANDQLLTPKNPPRLLSGLKGAVVIGATAHPGAADQHCVATQDGRLLGLNLTNGEVAPIFENLPKALGLGAAQANISGMISVGGRLVIANDGDYTRPNVSGVPSGRLAEWEWRGAWRMIDTVPYVDVVASSTHEAGPILALGYDLFSGLINVHVGQRWQRYRFPVQASLGAQPGQRIKPLRPGKWLLRLADTFFQVELAASGVPKLRPLAASQDAVHDFAYWQGKLVLAGGQDLQGDSFIKFTTLEELAHGPAASGSAKLWQNQNVNSGTFSDAVSILGFPAKTVHLSNLGAKPAFVDIEVDADATGVFGGMARLEIAPNSYANYVFPAGFSAAWMRLYSVSGGTLSASLTVESR